MEQKIPTPPPRPMPPPRPPRDGHILVQKSPENAGLDAAGANGDAKETNISAVDVNQNLDVTAQDLHTSDDVNIAKKTSSKTPKSKKFKVKMLVLIFAVLIVIAGGSVGTIFLLDSLKVTPLELGNAQIQVCQMTDRVYLVAEKTDCQQYVFMIEESSNQSTLYSVKNLVDITDFLQVGKIYSFCYSIQNQSQQSQSKFCQKKSFLYSKQLQSPVLRTENQTIYWQGVDYATNYLLYYFDTYGDIHSQNLTAKQGLNSFVPNFSIGRYEFWVVATSTLEGVQQSDSSNRVLLTLTESESDIESLTVDRDNCTITINLIDNNTLPTFLITIGSNVYTCTQNQVLDTYVIDLKQYTDKIPFGQRVSAKIMARSNYFVDGPVCFE